MKKTGKRTVAVFCSADENVSDTLKQEAKNIGEYLGKKDYELILGGTEKGLMRSVADGFLLNSSSIKLIMPEIFRQYSNSQHEMMNPENILWVETIRNQLETFESLSDSVIILPGGFGTLLELFNFLAHKKNKLLMDTDICLFNCEGFFNHLLSQIDVMMRENTLKEKEKNLLTVLNSIEDLKNFFN